MAFKSKFCVQFLGILCIFCEYLLAAPAVSQLDYQPIQNDDIKRNVAGSRHFWFDRRFRWSYGMIPYVLSSEYTSSEIEIIESAMRHWESKTCVRFVPRQPTDSSYVEITPDDGTPSYCYSYVGRQGGRQIMKMFGECMRNGAMLHELGHVVGFNHEHQRPDRDDYILIHFENINPAFHFAFDRFSHGVVDTMGTRYDFSSVMHYPFFAFTDVYDEARPAMTLKDGSIDAIYREAEYLSDIDVHKTQLYYQNCIVS
ncbi:Zinc metalloproteinase nas-15 [Pseudolycoriella hygida]|uniref:Metalloendopeptidase n=1 Tax=Pseudolycoriella hygida TaxID=35572 RepID=A0A9Q0MQP7_9DIPT|nr:Zinc metalloproteinase nas-15 [Pseudolycoriella hygida]